MTGNQKRVGVACHMHQRASRGARLLRRGILAALAFLLSGPALRSEIVRLGSNAWTHGAESVVVTAEALVHTAQLLPVDSAGNVVGQDVKAQTDYLLDNLQTALAEAGAQLTDTVKLNLYLRDGGIVAAVVEAVKHRFPKNARPAISLVETPLPHPDALVACDAVARRSQQASAAGVLQYRSDSGKAAQAAVLPAGPHVYISGQAARQGGLRQATVFALTRLRENLEFLGLGLSDTVQVKSFLSPMSAADSVEEWIHEFFGEETPPLVFVEWGNPEPIEIELIAAGRPRPEDSSAPSVEYLTPPGETASAVFTRIARLNHPTTIYISGLFSHESGDEADQIRGVFAQLGGAARRARSDLRHLGKATYYVATDHIGNQLTDFRKELYDPKRPPAASKATVAGVGVPGRVFTMDMIAAPARQSEASH